MQGEGKASSSNVFVTKAEVAGTTPDEPVITVGKWIFVNQNLRHLHHTITYTD